MPRPADAPPGWPGSAARVAAGCPERRKLGGEGVKATRTLLVKAASVWAAGWLAFACFSLCAFGGHAHHVEAGSAASSSLSATAPAEAVPVMLPDGRTVYMTVLATGHAGMHAVHGLPSSIDQGLPTPLGQAVRGPQPHGSSAAGPAVTCAHGQAAAGEHPLPGMPLLTALALTLLILPRPAVAGRWIRHLQERLTEGFAFAPEPVPRPA